MRWTHGGDQFVHATPEPTAPVRELLGQYEDVSDLEVRRATLEDTYIAMVQQYMSRVRSRRGDCLRKRRTDEPHDECDQVRFCPWVDRVQAELQSPQDQVNLSSCPAWSWLTGSIATPRWRGRTCPIPRSCSPACWGHYWSSAS